MNIEDLSICRYMFTQCSQSDIFMHCRQKLWEEIGFYKFYSLKRSDGLHNFKTICYYLIQRLAVMPPSGQLSCVCSFWAFVFQGVGVQYVENRHCGGKAGWNDRALLKTHLNARVRPGTAVTWVSRNYDKVLPNTSPSALSEVLLEIYKEPPHFSACAGLFKV